MTQPQTSTPAEALDLSFDLDIDVDALFAEATADLSEPSIEAMGALMRQISDAEIRDLPLPESLLPLHDEPLDLGF